MKKIFIVFLLASFSWACSKNPVTPGPPTSPLPRMMPINLFDAEVKYNRSKVIDINNDGRADLLFEVLLVGDPILQRDRIQFYVSSDIRCSLLNNRNDESPVLNKGDWIPGIYTGYTWYQASSIVMVEKLIYDTYSLWEGRWLRADHQYLPVTVYKNGKTYYGWVEISFNRAQEKMILHKAAISEEEDKAVKAGYF
jgi:hypothetical protein